MPGVGRPPSHTALAALPVVALDLETTGLDVANDRIVQIGAVPMRGPVLLHEPRIDTHVDPGVPISAVSTRIHGITDSEVAGAPKLAEPVDSLAEMLAGRVVVGQNIRFDLAVLRHEAARADVPWHGSTRARRRTPRRRPRPRARRPWPGVARDPVRRHHRGAP